MIARSILAAAVVVLAWPTGLFAADTQPASQPTPGLPDPVKALQAEATEWAKDPALKKPAINSEVSAMTLTSVNLASLRRELSKPQGASPMDDLYIRCQLLQPLRTASPEIVRPLLPVVEQINARLQYMEMPKITPQQLAILKTPEKAGPGAAANGTDRIQAMREKKFEQERPAVRNNILVREIKATVTAIRLQADQPATDQLVVQSILTDAERKLATYKDTLAAIQAVVPSMKANRAKSFYDQLKRIIQLAGGKPLTCIEPDNATLNGEDVSTFVSATQYPGIDVAEVENLLATAARQPAVAMPSRDEQPGNKPVGPQNNSRGAPRR